MNNSLLFFTTCDKHYKQFIIPYIYMANKFNSNAKFEFIIDKKDQILLNNIQKLKELCNINEIKILDLQDLKLTTNINFNLLRFLITPTLQADYTYIGDIDILITENILPFHLNHLLQNTTIFSNQLRFNNNNLMSGLHFVKSNEWYRKTNNIRQKYLNFNNKNCIDEEILANICKESNLQMPIIPKTEDEFWKNRPAHGIHISLNRKPFTNIMEFPVNDFINKFINTIYKTNEFKQVLSLCNIDFINTLNKCIQYSNNKQGKEMNFFQDIQNKSEINIFINTIDLLEDLTNFKFTQKCNIYCIESLNNFYKINNNYNFIYIKALPSNKQFDIALINSEFILNKLLSLNNKIQYIISNSYLATIQSNKIVYKYMNYIIYLYHNIIEIQNIKIIQEISQPMIINSDNSNNEKIGIIYTANIGNYDTFTHHKIYNIDKFDYVYITLSSNKNKIPDPWKTIYIDQYFSSINLENKNDTVRIARWCKTHPHILFPNYHLSIWMDGNTGFIIDPFKFINEVKFDYLLTQTHPDRNCAYKEANECSRLNADNKDIINKEIEFLKQNNYPENNGLVQSNILVRKHNNLNCIKYMEEWWNMIKNYSRRDQIAFNYIAWKFNLNFNTLPYKEINTKYIHWKAKH